jgi:hypothetical protein
MRPLLPAVPALLLAVSAAADTRPVVIGLLEDRSPEPRLRVAFEKVPPSRKDGRDGRAADDVGWKAMKMLEKRDTPLNYQVATRSVVEGVSRWNVCSRHQIATTLTTQGDLPAAHWGDAGTQKVALKERPRWVGVSTRHYSGEEGPPAHTPLVVTTAGKCTDPDQWTRMLPPRRVPDSLLTPFERVTQGLTLCTRDGTSERVHPERTEIGIVEAFRDRHGRQILQLAPRLHRSDLGPCPGRTPEFYYRLFLLDPEGEVHFMGAGTQIIDAGDFGGDGSTVIIAWMDDGHFNGYVLFPNDLKTRIPFTWPINEEVMKRLQETKEH